MFTVPDKIMFAVSFALTAYTGLDPYWGMYTAAPFHCAFTLPFAWFTIKALWASR